MNRVAYLKWIVLCVGACLASATHAQLGTVDRDLVFTPVAPCRIADTRVAGGVLAANTPRDFDVTAAGAYVTQGGDANNCNIGAQGSFAAVATNITVINPNVSGTLKAFALGTPAPTAAVTMNYAAGEVRTVFSIVKLDQGASANEMTLVSSAQAHVTIDVVGYFAQPVTTALECVEKTGTVSNIAAGSFGSVSTANCDAGYTITGGGCSMSTFDGRVVTTRPIVDGAGERQFCAFRNENTGSSTVNGVAYARCCRVPGRTP